MKRLHLSFLLLLVLHLTPSEVSAQVQRLAIPPQSFSLTRNGASHDAKAYCLDRHLLISEPTDFRAVLAGDTKAVRVGNRLMTLREAIDQNLITVKGAGVTNRRRYSQIDGTQLKFTSNTDEPITINFTHSVAMGEQGSSPVNPALLIPVRTSQSLADFRKVQDEVWWSGIEESRLEALGFYGSGTIVRNPSTTRNAVQAFQKKFDLRQQNGTLDDVTRLALSQVERQDISTFDRLGFRVARSDTDVPSVVDNIRAFEEFLRPRQIPTGKLTDGLRAELSKFADEHGVFIKQALKVDAARALPSDQPILENNPNVITFQKASYSVGESGPRALTAVMLKTTKGVELLVIENGSLTSIATGEKAIAAFDNVSRYVAALKFGSNTLAVRSGIYKPGGEVSLQLGAKVVKLSESDMARFLSGELKHPELDAALERLLANSTSRPRLIIFRSPFEQGRGGSAEDGGALLTQFGYKQHDPLKLAIAFDHYDEKFRDKFDVVIASDIERGFSNLVQMPKLSAGSQVGLFVDGEFKYSARIVDPIKKDIKKAGIKVLKVGDNPASQTRIFLFAGHRDEAYQQLVLRLADEGHFRGGVIALAVCGGGECGAQFNSLLISRSGARAVIFYNQEIKAQAVQDVILKFTQLLEEGVPNGNYHQLWRRAVDAVLEDATSSERNDIRKLRDTFIQVSTTWRTSSASNAE